MKQVAILVPEHAVLQAVADPQYCFSTVNRFLAEKGQAPIFDIRLVGAHREVRLHNGTYAVFPDTLTDELPAADLVIIPAVFGDMHTAVTANRPLMPWILRQHAQGAEIASLCVGAFLLASTGLLDGKKCSTHWGFIPLFRSLFPEVTVEPGNVVTEEDRILSSGGAHSYWNLLLHLVEKHSGREMAVLISKYFAIDINRDSQSAFAIFNGLKAHPDDDVRKVQVYIEEHPDERLTVDQLADMVRVGRRSLERRFKQATHHSILEYVQRVKVEAAKRCFESGRMTINEVMYGVGYSDTKAFRATFRKITGVSPLVYRRQFAKPSLS